MFSGESRFCQQHMDRGVTLWRRRREGFADCCTDRVGVERRACSPDLNPNEHLWDQLGPAVLGRVANTTTLADLGQMLVEE